MILLLALFACQDPFPEDRHDLLSFRIAAISATAPDAEHLTLRTFVYSGYGLWHPTVPTVTWSVGAESASGPLVTVPVAYPATIDLQVVDAEGNSEAATFTLDAAPTAPVIEGFTREVTELSVLDAGEAVSTRAEAVPSEGFSVAPEHGLRLSVAPADLEGTTTHWMGTAGTFAELDAHITDWFAATAEIDGDVVESHAPLPEGVVSVVALTLDGAGGNAWTYLDAEVGGAGPRLFVGGRIFPITESLSGAGWFEATLTAADTTAGVALTAVAPVSGPEAGAAVCGLPAGVEFDFSVLAEGHCDRDALEGVTVIVAGTATP